MVGGRERTVIVEGDGGKLTSIQLSNKALASPCVILPQWGIVSSGYAQFAQHSHIEGLLVGQYAVGQLEIVKIV